MKYFEMDLNDAKLETDNLSVLKVFPIPDSNRL